MSRNVLLVLLVLFLLVGGAAVALRKFSASEESRLAKLRPHVRAAFEQLRAYCAGQGIQIYVIDTVRTADQQDAKIAAGQSATKNSWHRLGRAVDFQVQIKDPAGGMMADYKATDAASYRKVHDAAPLFGFHGIPNGSPFTADGKPAHITTASGGKIWDVYHLEFSEGMTFAQAAARDGVAIA